MRKFFCRIAGVDPVALEDCPPTDLVWVAQLGFALVLNYVVVAGLTFYSVGYFIVDPYVRVAVALIVAAVLTTFDRALFQFDWFTVALMHEARALDRTRTTPLQRFFVALRPYGRLSLRLLVSLAIAYTLSVFVELAAFDSAIREKMTADNYVANKPYRDRVAEFTTDYDTRLAQRRDAINRLEGEIASLQRGFVSHAEQDEYDRLRGGAAEARAKIAAAEGTLADIEKRIIQLNEDIYAERYGLKDKPHRTGRPGCEPPSVCHDMVVAVKGLRDDGDRLRKEMEALQTTALALDGKASDLVRRRSASDSELIASRLKEIEALRADASAFEAQKSERVAEFEEKLKRDGVFRPLRDDPVIRVGVLEELRRDPVKGPSITEMSYLIKAFIAFLELAPVLAKIFFAPPTVYSARVRAAVVAGQRGALNEIAEQPRPTGVIDIYGPGEAKIGALATPPAPAQLEKPAEAPATALPKPAPPPLEKAATRVPESLPKPIIRPASKPLDRSNFGALERAVVSKLETWLAGDADRRHAAGDYYLSRMLPGRLLLESDMAIVDYSRECFRRDTRFFELGAGFGELSVCLALSGFATVGFEADAGRYAGASALVSTLGQEGYDMGGLALVCGFFPDAFRSDWADLNGDSVFVSTNVTSSVMMETIDHVIRSLKLFDHLIIDLSRFGEVRDVRSQRALVERLVALGFREHARVYALGDTDIRHFSRTQDAVKPRPA